MVSDLDNNILTQTGSGTPMGALMRRYWIPAALSTELRADGDPMRLLLLGEKLIAFRATDGKVCVMHHRCPHRCASLFYGRNEEGGYAASTTAGSSTRKATASTCRTCLSIRTSSTGSMPRPTRQPSRTALSGSIWEIRATSPPFRRSRHCCFRRKKWSSISRNEVVTGFRRWKATSIPRTLIFCMVARAPSAPMPPTIPGVGGRSIARPNMRLKKPNGA
ncbi:MAG: hypothetical protein EXR28_12395 [Betaproteobacteria bacterium]|nr:hypothetical protein [Betaproteobacteria bacterium]